MPRAATAEEVVAAAAADAPSGIYAKKLAVMAELGAIEPDAVHPHHGFPYISVQHLMNTLRPLTLKYGLDVKVEILQGDSARPYARTTLTDVTTHDEMTQTFQPGNLPEDPAGSYLAKYALMKLFLIGDGDDPDGREKAVAAKPVTARPAARPAAPATPGVVTLGPDGIPVDRKCPLCAAANITSRRRADGKTFPAKFWPDKTTCDGYREDVSDGVNPYVNHTVAMLVAAYAPISTPTAAPVQTTSPTRDPHLNDYASGAPDDVGYQGDDEEVEEDDIPF